MSTLIDALHMRPRAFHILAPLGAVLVLGWLDTKFDPDLSFLVLYLGPVLWAGWFAGKGASFLNAAAAGVAWWIDDASTGYSYAHPSIPYWNLGAKLAIFLVFGYVIAELRASVERRRRAERAVLDRELEIAREIQTLLLPATLPPLRTLSYAASCVPVREVGGDYYDMIPVSEDHLGIAVADASGKGIPAAMLMARLQGLLRSHAAVYGERLRDLVVEINRGMQLGPGAGKYATLFYGVYDDGARTLTFVNAGHNPPLLFQANGAADPARVVKLDTGGTVVGLLPAAAYEEGLVKLETNDVLVLFTDGVTEMLNSAQEEFGEERLVGLAAAHRHLSAQALHDLIVAELDRFRGAGAPYDDVTLVVAKAS